MASIVTDTHAFIWYLLDSPRLSANAKRRMDETVAGGDPILLPAICLVEITYLVEKGSIPAADWQKLDEALKSEGTGVRVVPLDDAVARTVTRVPRSEVPDMPDRIIAATALYWGVPLVTRDRKITASGIPVIW